MFTLPQRTVFNRVVPKNAFDPYTNTSQKRIFTQDVERIRWTHKLSKETINLEGKDIQEIQLFTVQLRQRGRIQDLIKIIDKAIPYTIIFSFIHESEVLVSVSKKHPHPLNPNNAVIDWTFSSQWLEKDNFQIELSLKESLDFVLKDLCSQLSGEEKITDLDKLVELKSTQDELKRKIGKLETQIKKEKQFNRRVELNRKLTKLKTDLTNLTKSS